MQKKNKHIFSSSAGEISIFQLHPAPAMIVGLYITWVLVFYIYHEPKTSPVYNI